MSYAKESKLRYEKLQLEKIDNLMGLSLLINEKKKKFKRSHKAYSISVV